MWPTKVERPSPAPSMASVFVIAPPGSAKRRTSAQPELWRVLAVGNCQSSQSGALTAPASRKETGFRPALEAAGITRPLASAAGGQELTIGDPEGIRTLDLHRDRVAC